MNCNNIIIVGNAASLLSRQNGHKINTFDCVVRMGNCITAGYEKYVGEKTDIYRASWDRLLHNVNKTCIYRPIEVSFDFHTLLFLENHPDNFFENVSSLLLKNNMKLFKKSFFAEISFPEHIFFKKNERVTHERCLEYFVKKYNITNIDYMDPYIRAQVFIQVNKPAKQNMVLPSSGILTLAHFLNKYPNDIITITGFDGFTSRYYWRNCETYFEGHSSYREKMYIKKLLKEGRVCLLE
jgi:hypothetical protein